MREAFFCSFSGPHFQYSFFFKGFYIAQTYYINIYYTMLKIFIYIGYIDIKIEK